VNERPQYEDFEATELFCPTCRKAQPVRRRLLLILPNGNKYDYVCSVCGASIGSKTETGSSPFGILDGS